MSNDYIWPIHLKLQEHELLSDHFNVDTINSDTILFLWKHHITVEFITATIDFIVKTRKSFPSFPSWPEYPLMQHLWG